MNFMVNLAASSARALKRSLGFGAEIVRGLEWHRKYSSPSFPPLSVRIVEQARLLRDSAINAEDYYNYALYRPELSYERKRAFLGYFEKTRYFNMLNPVVYDIVARNKGLYHLLADALDVPAPEVLATISAKGEPVCGTRLWNEEGVRAFFTRPDADNVFLKPIDGSFGEGALSLGARLSADTWERLPDRGVVSLDQIVAHLRNGRGLGRYLIQRRLRPHADMNAIVADICPSVRLMTLWRAPEQVDILGAALRLGNGVSPTDNLSGGGVVAAVDAVSGRLSQGVQLVDGLPVHSAAHPMTGVPIEGVQLPFWGLICEQVVTYAERFSFIPCIGWDVGITDQGPVIIEANTMPRARPVQLAHDAGLLDGALGVALARNNGLLKSGLRVRV